MSKPVVYLVSAARTAIGGFQGGLSSMAAPKLGAVAIQGALKRAGLAADAVGEVYMGNVLTAGVGQAPARQASLAAGIPNTVPATTVGKVCGSGLQAVILGAKSIMLGDAGIVVAGGMESMSNAPYYLQQARTGYRMGNGALVDGMIHDGLWDPYGNAHMGQFGDACASEFKFSREAQDAYAAESFRRAVAAQTAGAFDAEIEPVMVPQKKGDAVAFAKDEGPAKGDASKFAGLRPAFSKDGTITAANASPINDGASAVVLASESEVQARGLKPLAKILGYSASAQEPSKFTTAPALAINALLKQLGATSTDIDLYEINEAFAVVAMACAQICEIPLDRVNVRGGAVALGHPIGSSGSRVLTTLAYALKDLGKKRGIATLCIGGGEAVAVAIEIV